jgi:tRNA A37 N6-isopentenylltransferase MiaA
MSSHIATSVETQALAKALGSCEVIPYEDIVPMRGGQGAYIYAFLRNLPGLSEAADEVRSAIDAAAPSQNLREQVEAVYAAVCLIVDRGVRRR